MSENRDAAKKLLREATDLAKLGDTSKVTIGYKVGAKAYAAIALAILDVADAIRSLNPNEE